MFIRMRQILKSAPAAQTHRSLSTVSFQQHMPSIQSTSILSQTPAQMNYVQKRNLNSEDIILLTGVSLAAVAAIEPIASAAIKKFNSYRFHSDYQKRLAMENAVFQSIEKSYPDLNEKVKSVLKDVGFETERQQKYFLCFIRLMNIQNNLHLDKKLFENKIQDEKSIFDILSHPILFDYSVKLTRTTMYPMMAEFLATNDVEKFRYTQMGISHETALAKRQAGPVSGLEQLLLNEFKNTKLFRPV